MAINDNALHKRVYGRGFHDGLNAASKDRDKQMNHARTQELLAGQSGIARKVFDVVPIAEAWTAAQIRAELTRLGASNDIRIIDGCLRSLVDKKLIQEVGRGLYRRKPERLIDEHDTKPPAVVRDRSAPNPERTIAPQASEPAASAKAPEVANTASPLDMLCGISARMAEIAANMKQLQKDIDDAAMAIEQRFTESEKRNEKLIQLQQLLKSLN